MVNKLATVGVLIIMVCASFGTYAARPSITDLQQQINQLQAENNAQQAQIDAIPEPATLVDINGVAIGDGGYPQGGGSYHIVYFKVNEELYFSYYWWESDVFVTTNLIYYDLPACEGKPYNINSANWFGALALAGERDGILYRQEGSLIPSVTLYSSWNIRDGTCYESTMVRDMHALVPLIDLSSHPKPYKLQLLPADQ